MTTLVTIEQKVLRKNDDHAADNRLELDRRALFAVGLIGAPGAGKTALLERTLRGLEGRLRVGVVEGDVQSDRDARRIAALGVPVVQIVTNGTCHLEARMVGQALRQLPERGLDLLFVENVGNLVCPVSYDLGEHMRVVLSSVTEGEDKPLKYPAAFRRAQALVLSKVDLLPHLDYTLSEAVRFARQVNPGLDVLEVSSRSGAGLEDWLRYLELQVGAYRAARDGA
jgi:hydrogenase nickel incorporation protein HypB